MWSNEKNLRKNWETLDKMRKQKKTKSKTFRLTSHHVHFSIKHVNKGSYIKLNILFPEQGRIYLPAVPIAVKTEDMVPLKLRTH